MRYPLPRLTDDAHPTMVRIYDLMEYVENADDDAINVASRIVLASFIQAIFMGHSTLDALLGLMVRFSKESAYAWMSENN